MASNRPTQTRETDRQATPHAKVQRQVLIGLLSALAASAAYGATQTIARNVVTTTAPASVSATYTIVFGMLILLAMSARNLSTDLRAPRKAFVLMSIAGVCSSFGVFFMFTALSKAPVTLASPIGALNPLIAMALTHMFLQKVEKISPRMVAGGLLVVLGVTLVIVGQSL